MAEEKKNGVSVKKVHSEGNQKAKFVSRLETKYQEEIVPELMKEFGYSSIMECPKLVKIILNMRLGEAGSNSKSVEEAVKEMAIISGQHPIVTKAKKSVANFKLREGVPVGVKEQLIFPEISYDKVTRTQGMDVVIVTTAKTDKEAYALLSKLGMPFAK